MLVVAKSGPLGLPAPTLKCPKGENVSLERLEDRIEIANPQHPHCATVLVVDTSGSMSGDKIRQLNEGLRLFQDEVMADDLARKRVEAAIVSFGGSVTIEQDFGPIEDLDPPLLGASGDTPMGEAILTAVGLIRGRKQEYRDMGTDYFRPWIFLITDGEPTDMSPEDDRWRQAIEAVHAGEAAKEFLFFGVGVDPADMQTLKAICPPERPPARLMPGRFREMFAWLSRSQQRVSASRVGEHVPLENPGGPLGWAEIETI